MLLSDLFKGEVGSLYSKTKEGSRLTKDNVRVVKIGGTVFYHGREMDVVSALSGNRLKLENDGEIYIVDKRDCTPGTTGDAGVDVSANPVQKISALKRELMTSKDQEERQKIALEIKALESKSKDTKDASYNKFVGTFKNQSGYTASEWYENQELEEDLKDAVKEYGQFSNQAKRIRQRLDGFTVGGYKDTKDFNIGQILTDLVDKVYPDQAGDSKDAGNIYKIYKGYKIDIWELAVNNKTNWKWEVHDKSGFLKAFGMEDTADAAEGKAKETIDKLTTDSKSKDKVLTEQDIKRTARDLGYNISSSQAEQILDEIDNYPHADDDIIFKMIKKFSKDADPDRLASLERQLKQAKQNGDSEEAKEIQDEIDAIKSGKSEDEWGPITEAKKLLSSGNSSEKSLAKEFLDLNSKIEAVERKPWTQELEDREHKPLVKKRDDVAQRLGININVFAQMLGLKKKSKDAHDYYTEELAEGGYGVFGPDSSEPISSHDDQKTAIEKAMFLNRREDTEDDHTAYASGEVEINYHGGKYWIVRKKGTKEEGPFDDENQARKALGVGPQQGGKREKGKDSFSCDAKPGNLTFGGKGYRCVKCGATSDKAHTVHTKTGDADGPVQITNYRGYKISKRFDYNQGWQYEVIDPSGKGVADFGNLESAKRYVDEYTKDSKKTKDASNSEMIANGFQVIKEEEKNGEILVWYRHPKIRNHHFLLRSDRTGILCGRGSSPGGGIEDTLNNVKEVFNVYKNYMADSKDPKKTKDSYRGSIYPPSGKSNIVFGDKTYQVLQSQLFGKRSDAENWVRTMVSALTNRAGRTEITEEKGSDDSKSTEVAVWKCNECEKNFKKNVPKSVFVFCPKCGSEDIDLLGYTKDAATVLWKTKGGYVLEQDGPQFTLYDPDGKVISMGNNRAKVAGELPTGEVKDSKGWLV